MNIIENFLKNLAVKILFGDSSMITLDQHPLIIGFDKLVMVFMNFDIFFFF